MAITTLTTPFEFTKSWTDSTKFPTVQTNEAQVRADLQSLHDETKTEINTMLTKINELITEVNRLSSFHTQA